MSSVLVLLMLAATAAGTPLTLAGAVERAIQASPELRILRAAADEASANAALAHAAFHAGASISATPGYATSVPVAILGRVPAIGTIEAHQLLYDPAARATDLEAGAAQASAAAEADARIRTVAAEAAALFARVAADDPAIAAAERRVRAQQTATAYVRTLRDEGRSRDLDVERANLEEAKARNALARAKARSDLDRLRLRRMTAWSAREPLQIAAQSAELHASPADDTLGVATGRDMFLRRVDGDIDRLRRALDLQQRLLQPTVNAQVQYSRLFDRFGRFYLGFKPDDFSIGAAVELPLWTGGRRAANAARLTAQLRRFEAERDVHRIAIELEVRESESALAGAAVASTLANQAAELAQKSLAVARTLAEQGRGTVEDTLSAEAALAGAEEEAAEGHAGLLAATYRLLALRGELPGQP